MLEKIPFNDSWEFTPCFDEAFLAGGGREVRIVDLPHTVAVTPFHYFDESAYQMLSGYRKVVSVPAEWAGKRLFVRFGAAAHFARVYANGAEVCTHACGYTAFEAELTGFMTPGADLTLIVELDSRETLDIPPFGHVIDYMTYGGLYREVELLVREQTYLADVFVKPEIPAGQGELPPDASRADAEKLSFTGTVHASLTIRGEDADGVRLRVLSCDERAPLSEKRFSLTSEPEIALPSAGLWDALSPALYLLEVSLLRGETPLDVQTVPFGFRRAEFRTDGFFLNGRKLKLRGLNRHQSYPYVGYAMPASMQRLDADILKKELGCNAVRTSHYPQSQHFIDRCDEIGLLVFTESPGWQHIGGAQWKEQVKENVREMVTQYRNHPSIILWGVRINESQDDDELYTATNALAHGLDPTRQTGGVRYLKKSRLLEDVYTYNDFLHSGENAGCEKKKNVTSDPSAPYLISEYNGHMFPTKAYDSEAHRLGHALRHANVLDAVAGEADIAGSFGWCMFDYNTHKDFGSGDRVCYHGVTDMFRNPKMAAAVYAALGREEPFLEISGTMDIGEHPGGFRGRLFAFTNADSVRVYKNDRFIREYTNKDSPYKNLAHPPIGIDDLIGEQMKEEGFSPRKEKLVRDALNLYARCGGKNLPASFYFKMLRAMLFYRMKYEDAYRLYGKYLGNWGDSSVSYRFDAIVGGKVVRSVTKAPMHTLCLEVLADRRDISFAETFEVVSLRVRVCDENGNTLPFFNGVAGLAVEGPLVPYGCDECRIEGGAGGVYLRTVGTEGEAKVTLSLPGAAPVALTFRIFKK